MNRLRKKSRNPRAILKDKLWKVFSLFVRTREKFICFTCGAQGNRKTTNAGHFKHNVLDFDEVNIHCQCIRCNKWLHGHLDVYASRLIEVYGLKAFEDLCFRAKTALRGERMSMEEMQRKLDLYTLACQTLTQAV